MISCISLSVSWSIYLPILCSVCVTRGNIAKTYLIPLADCHYQAFEQAQGSFADLEFLGQYYHDPKSPAD